MRFMCNPTQFSLRIQADRQKAPRNQKVSSSNRSIRRMILGLCSSIKSSVVLSAPAVVSRSETIRLEASLALEHHDH